MLGAASTRITFSKVERHPGGKPWGPVIARTYPLTSLRTSKRNQVNLRQRRTQLPVALRMNTTLTVKSSRVLLLLPFFRKTYDRDRQG